MTIHCTYCWQSHYGFATVDDVIKILGCGHDRWRYFTTHHDYIRYVRQYMAGGRQHFPLGQPAPAEQLRLL